MNADFVANFRGVGERATLRRWWSFRARFSYSALTAALIWKGPWRRKPRSETTVEPKVRRWFGAGQCGRAKVHPAQRIVQRERDCARYLSPESSRWSLLYVLESAFVLHFDVPLIVFEIHVPSHWRLRWPNQMISAGCDNSTDRHTNATPNHLIHINATKLSSIFCIRTLFSVVFKLDHCIFCDCIGRFKI